VFFSAPHPLFGRSKNKLSVSYQQRSPFYWWWAYLRRNADYLACCDAGGAGKLAALYADFGDVREDDFHKWWTEDRRAVRLFAEPPLTVRFGELTAKTEWDDNWTSDDVMVVVVPLNVAKRSLKGEFNKLLNARHKGKQGRPAIANMESRALYKLTRNYTIANLQTTLAVYDLWLARKSQTGNENMTLWQIGVKLNLNREAAFLAQSDSYSDRLVGRNLLGATVGRYVTQAKRIIESTALGVFPAY
jgi:hypothetical protein